MWHWQVSSKHFAFRILSINTFSSYFCHAVVDGVVRSSTLLTTLCRCQAARQAFMDSSFALADWGSPEEDFCLMLLCYWKSRLHTLVSTASSFPLELVIFHISCARRLAILFPWHEAHCFKLSTLDDRSLRSKLSIDGFLLTEQTLSNHGSPSLVVNIAAAQTCPDNWCSCGLLLPTCIAC